MRRARSCVALLLALCVAVAAIGGPVALAQDGEELAELTGVRLWVYPEYDDPGLLVMLGGQVLNVDLPVTVHFLMPSDARVHSTATHDDEGGHFVAFPTRVASSIPGWDEISFETEFKTFRFEYYHDAIVGQPDKTISYQFRPLHPISDLSVYFQEPRASSSYSVTGEGPQSRVASDGMDARFPARLYSYLNVTAGSVLDFEIAYTKSDPSTSIPSATDSGAAQGSGPSSGMVIGIVLAALVVLGGGAYLIYQDRKRQPGARRGRAGARAAARRSQGGKRDRPRPTAARRGGQGEDKFCRDCGTALDAGSRFCPDCGARTR